MMSDPMDSPPTDHGSDRYDYVEVSYKGDLPETFELVPWVLRLWDQPCLDCRANVFMHYNGPEGGDVDDRHNWLVTIAHDDGCPSLDEDD